MFTLKPVKRTDTENNDNKAVNNKEREGRLNNNEYFKYLVRSCPDYLRDKEVNLSFEDEELIKEMEGNNK